MRFLVEGVPTVYHLRLLTGDPLYAGALIAIAAALGVTVRRVSMLKKEGLPTDSVEAAVKWKAAREGQASGRRDSAEELRRKRIALLAQQERKARLEADREEGRLIEINAAKQLFLAVALETKSHLRQLENELPCLLEGTDAAAIRRVLRERFDGMLNSLSKSDFGQL